MDVTQTPEPDRTLADYLELIWQFKVLIIGVAAIAGAAAAVNSLRGPDVYESTVTFAATASKIGEAGQQVASTAAFRPMVESLSTAAAVIKEVGLDKPPLSMTPSDFLESVILVNEIRGTNLITVKVDQTNAALAATIANSVAEHAVQTARKVSASEASHARDLIKEQLDLALVRLNDADGLLRDYRRQVRVEALRRDVEARLGGPQLPVFSKGQSVVVGGPSSDRSGLMDLGIKIASERARLGVIERDLSTRNRIDPATRGVDGVFQRLEADAAAMRSNVASLEKERSELMGAHVVDAATSAVLDKLYAIESELARRQSERDLAEKIYIDLSARYQEARLQVIGRSAEFVIIDPAMPSDKPLSRHVARNAVAAMAIWFSFATAGVLVWESTRRRVRS